MPALPTEQLLEGEVVAASALADRSRFTVQVARRHEGRWRSCRFAARLSAYSALPLLPGDRIRALVQLTEVPAPANPGAPDLRIGARSEGVAAYGTVRGLHLAAVGPGSRWRHWAGGLRRDFGELAERACAHPDSAALVRALALGDRAELGPDVNDDFALSGLAHVLSISGLHIAVVAAGLYGLLRWLLSLSERLLLSCDVRALASAAAIPATWIYVAASGAEVPAVRSGVMATALLLGRALQRDADAPTSLGAALLVVLAWDPSAIHALGFQLSFASVAGLMLLSGPLRSWIPLAKPNPDEHGWRNRALRAREVLLQSGCASLAASLATAPLLAAAFHRASLISVAANAAALPVASALTLASAAAASLYAVAGDAAAVLPLLWADPLARLLLWLSHQFASVPLAAVPLRAPGALATLAWYLLLAAVPLRHAGARLARPLALASAAVLALCWALPSLHGRGELRVTFLSVGQGDSTLVQFPDGRSLLIDAGGDPGGRFDPGERIVVPALVDLGVSRPDAIAISHPHPDHALGVLAVLRRLGAGELWMPPGHPGELRQALQAAAAGAGARALTLSSGSKLDFGGAHLEVLHPPAAADLEGNDSSLALRIELGEVRFLFPGDLEAEGERSFLRAPDVRADVLKVPHHGSETSSSQTLIERVAPHHVVFCVGARNRFGFPKPSVVSRYEQAGCRLHRTDRDGAVTFTTDGRSLRVAHWL